MAAFPVKYINNAMRGAPVLNGQAGTLIGVLDAFLLTGFGTVSALSVNVAGGIATAAVQAGNSFDKGCIVWVDGATPAALNGEQRVLTASSAAITFATTAPDGPATGTITIKVAPVGGWEKKYSGTNKAVYRSTDPQASGFCLRVDDTGTTTARVRGFESMTDVDTGSGPFPIDAQISGGGHQWKSVAATAAATRYDLIADSRTILIAVAPGVVASGSNIATPIRGFGDMIALAPGGDGFAVAISCASGASISSAPNFVNGTFDRNASGEDAIYWARSQSGLGGSKLAAAGVYVGAMSSASGADTSLGAFPSSVDGELKYSRCYVHADDGATPRANVPGVLRIPQTGVATSVSLRDTFLGTGEMAGRMLLALGVTNTFANGGAVAGVVLVDITGPWR